MGIEGCTLSDKEWGLTLAASNSITLETNYCGDPHCNCKTTIEIKKEDAIKFARHFGLTSEDVKPTSNTNNQADG